MTLIHFGICFGCIKLVYILVCTYVSMCLMVSFSTSLAIVCLCYSLSIQCIIVCISTHRPTASILSLSLSVCLEAGVLRFTGYVSHHKIAGDLFSKWLRLTWAQSLLAKALVEKCWETFFVIETEMNFNYQTWKWITGLRAYSLPRYIHADG